MIGYCQLDVDVCCIILWLSYIWTLKNIDLRGFVDFKSWTLIIVR